MNEIKPSIEEVKEEEGVITLRYIPISKQVVGYSLLAPQEKIAELSREMLTKLGIKIKDGEKPLDAWLRAMSQENGLEYTTPVHRAITNAILSNSEAYRFMFFIS